MSDFKIEPWMWQDYEQIYLQMLDLKRRQGHPDATTQPCNPSPDYEEDQGVEGCKDERNQPCNHRTRADRN